MISFLKQLFAKKPLQEIGECFEHDKIYYKRIPLPYSREIEVSIRITDTTCDPKILFIREFHKKFPAKKRTKITSLEFFNRADTFIKGKVGEELNNKENIEKLITRLKFCCPIEFQEIYGKKT